ncbi:hypothetical protein ABZZ17_29600 [Streptomyces sp. NPDC006512]|uniref:hypothetical protein n=1 Tax=Streptomyces sp. NPDC006512 TaxID=3154307 RepID=UPI0033B30325
MHPHLREGAQEVIGSGPVGYMKPGSHRERGARRPRPPSAYGGGGRGRRSGVG